MSTFRDFKLPDLGEGLTEGEIIKWLVQPGDAVTLNQPIVEVETAKAAVEIPSPYAGVVTQLHHAEGATVDVGMPIITFDTDSSGSAADVDAAPPQTRTAAAADMVPQVTEDAATEDSETAEDEAPFEPGIAGSPAPKAGREEKIEVLVGTGPKTGKLTRRPRKPAATQSPARPAAPKPPARESAAGVGAHAARRAAPAAEGQVHVLAKPPVRKLARDLDVDLRSVAGTGPQGSITRADVEAAAGTRGDSDALAGVPELVDFDPSTREERIPIRGIRKATATAMVSSAFTAPHVTEWVAVDVTPTMEMVDRLDAMPEFADVRVSPLLLVAKSLIVAVRRHPLVNATWDEEAQEIVVKGYVNLGIATATSRGLLVPNIKNAGALSLPDLAHALRDVIVTAREGKASPADMQHGTITITNIGVFGIDGGTPILNPGESAILCFGAVREQPWVHEGQLAVRQVTQLAMSFDHRLVDGQLASEFLGDVAAMLTDPALLIAWA